MAMLRVAEPSFETYYWCGIWGNLRKRSSVMVRWPLGLCLWKAISSGWELFLGFVQYVVGESSWNHLWYDPQFCS